ncbi:MAG: helix-turn-helix transcriptional regulator [Acutalibacteraceae bacterium]|nr:helix-turn-helix transcriptional regulator [Acutalibacteraceae bacterium]
MEDLKQIIAGNIQELRKEKKMTQNDLAALVNYTDKAVSKWERGESLPDIIALKQIADTFCVPVDYLLTAEHTEYKKAKKERKIKKKFNRRIITYIAVVLVWLVAIFVYMNIDLFSKNTLNWLVFLYAVPASAVVSLIFNSIWGNRRINYIIISIILWSVLAAVYVTLFCFSYNVWLLFLLGIPGQIIVYLWSRLKV